MATAKQPEPPGLPEASIIYRGEQFPPVRLSARIFRDAEAMVAADINRERDEMELPAGTMHPYRAYVSYFDLSQGFISGDGLLGMVAAILKSRGKYLPLQEIAENLSPTEMQQNCIAITGAFAAALGLDEETPAKNAPSAGDGAKRSKKSAGVGPTSSASESAS